MSRPDLESLYNEHLPHIDRLLAVLARRHGLSPNAAAKFAAWAKARLIADDYALLAKFRGQSSVTTYLAVVLANLYRDYRRLDF